MAIRRDPSGSGRIGAHAPSGELALEVAREIGDGREVEQLRQINLARVLPVDLFVDLDELEGARADLEEIVVNVDALALERGITDRLEFLLDGGERVGLGRACGGAQPRELTALSIELPVDELLLEQVALDLAARGLRDAFYRHHLRDLEPGPLVDEP